MIPHTIRNAMAVANAGNNRTAYLYRYRDGEIHVVIVDDNANEINHQYVVTQYPFVVDPSRTFSNLRVAKRNGYLLTKAGEVKAKTRPGNPSAPPCSAFATSNGTNRKQVEKTSCRAAEKKTDGRRKAK